MSRTIKSTNANKKPICTFCLNLGKTESEYSHYTYSLPDHNGKSKTLCQELLATECKYCFKLGHTVKYCPALKQNEIVKARVNRKAKVEADNKPKNTAKKSVSSFAALMDSDSDEEEKVSKANIIDNFPILNTASKQEEPKQLTGWAAIAAKPVEATPEPAQKSSLLTLTKNIKYSMTSQQEIQPVEAKPEPVVFKQAVITKSWADLSDSEEEDDEPVWYQKNGGLIQEEIDEDW